MIPLFVTARTTRSHTFSVPPIQVKTLRPSEGISEEKTTARVNTGSACQPRGAMHCLCTLIKPSAGKLREAEGAAASQHPVGLKAPVKLIVSSAPNNDEVRGRGGTDPGPRLERRKLNSDSRPHITALRSGYVYSTGNAGRGWLSNNVKQHFANLARTGANRVPLFILERIDGSICVQGEDHRFSEHFQNLPLSPLDLGYSTGGLNRRLTAPAIPIKPVPRSNMLAGSGTALPVIWPWTVVMPLLDAGGTRFNGLLVIE